MRISEIIWLEEVVDKLRGKHGVEPEEVEALWFSLQGTWLPETGGDMSGGKSSVSAASSYQKIGEYWDEHDLEDAWDPSRQVEFEVEIESRVRLFSLDRELSRRIDETARQRGISSQTLLNLWVQEKLQQAS